VTGGRREALLRRLVWLGVAVALITEVLGAFHWLRRGPLVAAWVVAGTGAVVFRRRRGRQAAGGAELFDAVLVGGVVVILAFVGITALLSPPNSADAMAYHLPRVVYWAKSGSVSFFPTPYYNQIMLQPLAEYFALHTYLLSGGDRYVNLVQWMGFAGSIIAVSLVALALGASRRGQVMAAVFCATIPGAILQASGAKNDLLLALWLTAMAYFGLRYAEGGESRDLLWTSLALGLALATKGTAYLFAPALLVGVFGSAAWKNRGRLARAVPTAVLCVLAVNGPQYWRNLQLSGSPLGFDSAQGDGLFRWRNEDLGVRPTVSNLARNVAVHLGARSAAWNQGVYQFVVRAHERIGIDVSDPATTWRWEHFRPPVNSNHEADAPNRWHLLLLAAAVLLMFRWGRQWGWYGLGVVLGFVLFCFYLKWMPWVTRLQVPLFVAGAPLVGRLAEGLRPRVLQVLLGLFLLNNARPYVVENWTRPLRGPRAVWRVPRDEQYFADMKQWDNRADYLQAVAALRGSGCRMVGIDISQFQLEYPLQALLLEAEPDVKFVHTGVENVSRRYESRPPPEPCAVACLGCAGNQGKIERYRKWGQPEQCGTFLVFGRR
jgi:4-amino-4-deoxy-L-arabinose transferase-like glycosyltransferase